VITALYLFAVQAVLGGFDTLYYHEWRARLPGGVPGTAQELRLHAARDIVYAILFGSLPFIRYDGAYVGLLAALLAAEIVVTMCDFVVEDRIRRPLGGVFAGERVTHAVMGIIYGAALAYLVPVMLDSVTRPTALTSWSAPALLRFVLPVMAAGVLVSGLRDLGAVYGPAWLRYPWHGAAGAPATHVRD
jgi:hypothetical protein